MTLNAFLKSEFRVSGKTTTNKTTTANVIWKEALFSLSKMWDPGCILIVLFFCHVYFCYSNKSVNKLNAFVTLRWFIWRKRTYWRCDMLAPSPRQLLRPSASSKQGRTFHRWARWRHTGSGQRGAWVSAEALDRCSGKHGHWGHRSEYQDSGGEMCTYGE